MESPRIETYNRKQNRLTARLRGLGLAAIVGFSGGIAAAHYGSEVGKAVQHGAEVIDQDQSPTQKQLTAGAHEQITVQPGNTIWSIVNSADPNVNPATNQAIIQYVTAENHGSATVVPGESLAVPVVKTQ